MKMKTLAVVFVIAGCLALSADAEAQHAAVNWVGSWASSQQLPEPQNSLPSELFNDATLRQIVHLSLGGPALRVHLSNAFGFLPLHLTGVHVARALSPSGAVIDPATDKAVRFSGREDVTIPAGAEFISDPIEMMAAPFSDLAVSIHFDLPPAEQTGHPGSRATSYLVHGDAVSASDLPGARKFDHWYQLAAIDVAAQSGATGPVATIVAVGDSITDGHGATTNGNDRWTDVLAQRLQANAQTRNIGVLNQGIGGNHLLTDGLGPNVLARFDRDVLAQTGVRWVIVLEGVNDLGGLTRLSDPPHAEHEVFVQRMLAAYQQIVIRAHAAHLRVLGATISPYTGSDYYHPPTSNEADRQTINGWIRAPGHFDAVIDFDKALADPQRPDHVAAVYDSGDHLHPSAAGYRAMGELIPLTLFAP
jgi:lysophospholipase L1-like esterase